jgi:hypothetical protein
LPALGGDLRPAGGADLAFVVDAVRCGHDAPLVDRDL